MGNSLRKAGRLVLVIAFTFFFIPQFDFGQYQLDIGLVAVSLAGPHEVKKIEQKGDNDCGPTAAASCMDYWRNNGYGDLPADPYDDLSKKAGTDEKGTWIHKLRDAMNGVVDGTKNKGQLKAKLPKNKSDYSLAYIQSEFDNTEDVILLLTIWDSTGARDHYVTVRNVTGSGATRTVEYMDPADGQFHTTTVNANLKATPINDGDSAKVSGILTMSPANSTSSTSAPVDSTDPSKGTKITYTVYYPTAVPGRAPKDLHIKVWDCDKSNYMVNNLPPGWMWNVRKQTVDGKLVCVLSIWNPTGSASNGMSFEVIYKGAGRVDTLRDVVGQTTSGTDSASNGVISTDDGITVKSAAPLPSRPGKGRAVVQDPRTVQLQWDAPLTGSYQLWDDQSGELVVNLFSPIYTLSEFEGDAYHFYYLTALDDSSQVSAPGDRVMVWADEQGARFTPPGSNVSVPLQLSSYGHTPHLVNLLFQQVAVPGMTEIMMLTAAPQPPLPPNVQPFPDLLYLSTTAQTFGPIVISLSYDSADAAQSLGVPHLYYLNHGSWIDVTQLSNPSARTIQGFAPGTGLFAIAANPCTIGKGDMDGDLGLTASDVVLMLNCVFLGDGICVPCIADVNCDGFLTSEDVVLELNAVFLGFPFPCQN